jgi:hypothetical protein
MVNPENSHNTRLVLEKGHLWGDRDLAIPINTINNDNGQAVAFKLDKKP